MKLKRILAMGLVIGGLCSLIFFSLQHRLEYKTYKIEETWEMGPSLTILLKEITIKKFMDDPFNFEHLPWYRTFLPYSPDWLIKPIYLVGSFLSMPHRFDFGEIQVKGLIAGDPNWRDKYDIRFSTEGSHYVSNGVRTQGMEGGSTYFFTIYKDNIPREDLEFSKLYIKLDRKGTCQVKTLEYIPGTGFTDVIYDFYEKRPAEYGFDPTKVATTFISDIVMEGKKELVEKQVHPTVKDTFPWSYIPQELENRRLGLHNPFPTYQSEFKGFNDVYAINLEYSLDEDMDTVIGVQQIYLTYDEDSWKIIDLTPFQKIP